MQCSLILPNLTVVAAEATRSLTMFELIILLPLVSCIELKLGNYVSKEDIDGNADQTYTGYTYNSLIECGVQATAKGSNMFAVTKTDQGYHCIFDNYDDISAGKWTPYKDEGNFIHQKSDFYF